MVRTLYIFLMESILLERFLGFYSLFYVLRSRVIYSGHFHSPFERGDICLNLIKGRISRKT